MSTRPDGLFESVLWWSMALFYMVGGLTVASWVFECPFRLTLAGVFATGVCYIGAWHAREIHVNNRVGRTAVLTRVNADEDWEKGEA